MSIERIKDRIRKLMNVAENDASTEGEIDNAMRFARQMMESHHLSEEDLAVEPVDQWDAIDKASCGRFHAMMGSKIYLWETSLGWFVGRFVGGVKHYLHTGCDRKKAFVFYGVEGDARLAADLMSELRETIIAMARLRYGGCFKGKGGSYSEGFVSGLSERLKRQEKEEREKLTSSGDTTGMILVERRADLVKRKVSRAETYLTEELGIRLSSGASRSGSRYNHEAFQAGQADGRRANVSARAKISV